MFSYKEIGMLRANRNTALWVAFAALAVLASLNVAGDVFAAAVVETVAGDVKAGPSAKAVTAVSKGQRIEQGTTVVTGPKGLVVLGFDDGQKMIVNENSQFRVVGYSFNQDEPKKDLFSFALLKGALRSVTSLFTRRNSNAYALRIPQATIGIRGTDFMVGLVNPAYMSVTVGSISATNAGGTAGFAAGSTVSVASANALAVTIPVSALPASVATAFSQLSSVAVGAGALAGAGGGAESGAGGIGAGGAAAAAALIAVGAALAGGGGDDDDGPSGTTGTTGNTSAP
jgi:hypothetical protein